MTQTDLQARVSSLGTTAEKGAGAGSVGMLLPPADSAMVTGRPREPLSSSNAAAELICTGAAVSAWTAASVCAAIPANLLC